MWSGRRWTEVWGGNTTHLLPQHHRICISSKCITWSRAITLTGAHPFALLSLYHFAIKARRNQYTGNEKCVHGSVQVNTNYHFLVSPLNQEVVWFVCICDVQLWFWIHFVLPAFFLLENNWSFPIRPEGCSKSFVRLRKIQCCFWLGARREPAAVGFRDYWENIFNWCHSHADNFILTSSTNWIKWDLRCNFCGINKLDVQSVDGYIHIRRGSGG